MTTENLNFSHDQISALDSGLLAGEYNGDLVVDYSTGTVTGTLTASPITKNLPLISASNFTLTTDPVTGLHTLTSPGDGLFALFTVQITYSGDAPTQHDIAVGPGLGSSFLPAFSATGNPVTSTLVPCFVRGSLVATPDGERAVEDLAIGDMVTSASGEAKKVLWVGTRSYNAAFIANNKKMRPVCIGAGALDDNLPKRDLYLSPCHAVLIDGLLVPAGELVNGTTITQAKLGGNVDYFHIELDQHDMVVVEGVTSETYIDDANRNMFQNVAEYYAAYPDREDVEPVYAARRVDDGEELEAIRTRLAARARTFAQAA